MGVKSISLLILIFLVLAIFAFSFSRALSFGSGIGARITVSNETTDSAGSSDNSDNSDDSSSSSSSSSSRSSSSSNKVTGDVVAGSISNKTNTKLGVKSKDYLNVNTTAGLEDYILSISSNSTIKSIKVKSSEIKIIIIQKTKILGFIPKDYDLSILIDIDQDKYSNNRVKLEYPWYVKPGLNETDLQKKISTSQDLNDLDLQTSPGKQVKIISAIASEIEAHEENISSTNKINTQLISIPGL